MSIAAYTHTANFTIISNACFNDERLSFEALAIFTYLRSKPTDWIVRQKELARRFKAGRDRVRNAINELIAAGYIRKVQERIAGRWSAAGYDVLALPDAPAPEAPLPETPTPENRSPLNTDLLPNTDSTKEQSTNRHTADAADASAVDQSPKAAPRPIIAEPLPSSSGRNPRMHRQSMVEANRAFEELQRLDGWGGTWEDDPLIHWHALLRKGYAAEDIVDAALDYLRRTFPDEVASSLGDWLACLESYLEDDDSALSPSAQCGPATSHHLMQGV